MMADVSHPMDGYGAMPPRRRRHLRRLRRRLRRQRMMRARRARAKWPPRYRRFEGSVQYPGQEFPGEMPEEQYYSVTDEMAYSPEGEVEDMMGYGWTPQDAARAAAARTARRMRARRRWRQANVISPAITQGPAPLMRWPKPPPIPIATFPQPWPPSRLIKSTIGTVQPRPAILRYGPIRRPRGQIIGREGSVAAPMPNPITYPFQWERWRRRYPRKAARWIRNNRSMYLRHKQALRAMRMRRRGGPQARVIRQQGPLQMPLQRFDPTRPGLESGTPVAPEEAEDIVAEAEEAAMVEAAPEGPDMKRLLLFGGLGAAALVGFAAMRKKKKKKKKSA